MRDFLDQSMQQDPARRPRAAVLLRHKWVQSRACTPAELSRLLQKVFAARAYSDV